METIYLWCVHDYRSNTVELSEAEIVNRGLPVQYMELSERYQYFAIDRKDANAFWQKINTIFPCPVKIYEFSEHEILLGEHYLDPVVNIHTFVPWIDVNTLRQQKCKRYDYFFFADFNATFAVTDKLLTHYLKHLPSQFVVLDCVKTEPAFYTDDKYYVSKIKVEMQYADVLLVMGLLFKMVVENHRLEDEGSMTLLYGLFRDGSLRVFDRWCIANIWALSHDASFGHEMPLYCQWELEQAVRRSAIT